MDNWPTTVDEINELNDEEFEEFVARLWSAQGYETTVTQGSRDAGVDVVAGKDEERIAIQAKLYRSARVTGPEVQQYSAIQQDDAYDGVIIVTTGDFTRDALERGNDYGVRLIKGEKLAELAERYQPSSETSNDSSRSNQSGLGNLFREQSDRHRRIQIEGILLLAYGGHFIIFADLISTELIPWLTSSMAAFGWFFGIFLLAIIIYKHAKLKDGVRNPNGWSLLSFFIPMIGPSIYIYQNIIK